MTRDELKKIMPEDLRRINNQGYINQNSLKNQEKWSQLIAKFRDVVCVYDRDYEFEVSGQKYSNHQQIIRQDYACLIWNVLNTLVLYRSNNLSPFVLADQKHCDDFLNRAYVPLSYLNSANSDWCSNLFISLIVDMKDHNLYFLSQLMMPNQSWQGFRIPVDNYTIDVVRRVLIHSDRTAEMEKVNIPLLKEKRGDWNRYRFESLVGLLNNIRELRVSDYSFKLDSYRYCSIVINGLYYIYDIDDKQAKLLGETNNTLTRNYLLEHTSYSYNPWCLRMAIKPPVTELKADMNVVLPLLQYFTMGDKATFDKLARDFVHCIMLPGFKYRNTMVKGDRVKLLLWIELIGLMMSCVELFDRGRCVINSKLHKDLIEPLMDQKDYCTNKHVYIPYNENSYAHVYQMCSKDKDFRELDMGNKYIHLEFKYGGNNYDLEELGQHDLIWLVELFFAHGWHLINEAAQSHKAKTRDIEQKFIERFLCKDGTYVVDGVECLDQNGIPHLIRLPLALVYELYKAYASKEKQTATVSNTELREIIEKDYLFSYSGQKSTEIDIVYVSKEIQPFMEKMGLHFDEKWISSDNKKVFCCTLKDEFWQTLATSIEVSETVGTSFESFDKYIKELYARYQHMFVYNTEFLPEAESQPKPYKLFDKYV